MQRATTVHGGTLSGPTEWSPEKVLLGSGTEVIPNVGNIERIPGLFTEEGRSGFLVSIKNFQAQYLMMSPGLYSEEHAHDYGFMIFTTGGRWVLCSEGRRCLMVPGSICSVQEGASMGMECPFKEAALLLFFLEGGNAVRAKYEEYLKRVSGRKTAAGEILTTRIADLPASHPARVFAERVSSESEV